MGSPLTESDRYPTEQPIHLTIRRGFWLGQYEVTQREWHGLMGSNPNGFNGNERLPVDQVSWNDCQEFVGKLNEREKAAGRLPGEYVYRLPTQAEWEYACRAGTTTKFSFGNSENQLGEYAWTSWGNRTHGPHPVGEKKPNAWGFYDMHGNVEEWCGDWHLGPRGIIHDPMFGFSNSNRVFRGGAWFCPAYRCRSASLHLSAKFVLKK